MSAVAVSGRLGSRGSRADRICEIEARIAELVKDRAKGDWGGANAASFPKMDEMTELHHELYRLKKGLPASPVRSSSSRDGATRSASPFAPPRKPGRLPEVSYEREREWWRLGGLRSARFRAVADTERRKVTLSKYGYETISQECEAWDGVAEAGGCLTTFAEGFASWRDIAITGASVWDVSRGSGSLGVPRDINLKHRTIAGIWHTHPTGNPGLSAPDRNILITTAEESGLTHSSGEWVAVLALPNAERGDWHSPALVAYVFRCTDDGWIYEPAALTVKS